MKSRFSLSAFELAALAGFALAALTITLKQMQKKRGSGGGSARANEGDDVTDMVDEASEESFPASDPPAW